MNRRLQMVAASLLATFVAGQVLAGDWPSWRGPNRDGISSETGLLTEWPEGGPKLLWQVDGLGGGYSSLAIADGKIYTMGRQGGGTHLIALNQKEGEKLWATSVGGGNPNCTPTVDGSLVYALGRDGDLVCADAQAGSVVWKKNFGKDFGGKMMSGWGYSESPLVDGDLLICTPGSGDAYIAALDKTSGRVIWKSGPTDAGFSRGRDGAAYSSVVVSKGAGVKQYIQLNGRGVFGVRASDGKFLWSYNKIANGTANIPTPIIKGDYVFCSTGYGTGAALLELKKTDDGVSAEEVYFLPANKFQNHHGGMILVGDYIFCGHGHNKGFPLCIEMMTGKKVWDGGRGPGAGSAAILQADNHLYFRYENGVMALIESTPAEYNLKGSFRIATADRKTRSWPHPVISDKKLYLRDQQILLCYDLAK
ncbi:MAG: polyvinylalcohol dehydrogenase [Planctomycetaceae bacterium]|nr:polyvinylalcohol dehydrogenase [Planctomycetaceae bacterium]